MNYKRSLLEIKSLQNFQRSIALLIFGGLLPRNNCAALHYGLTINIDWMYTEEEVAGKIEKFSKGHNSANI